MNTERILIYRDNDRIKRADVNYKGVQMRLQKLLTALRTLKVQPTIQELETIILDNEWIDIFEKSKKNTGKLSSNFRRKFRE